MPQREHTHAPTGALEIREENITETTTTYTPHVVVNMDDSDTLTQPCLNDHYCKYFKNLDIVNRAIEIYKTAANKNCINNPVGYVCTVCRRGAIYPDNFKKPEDQEARREAERNAKAMAKAEEVARREAEEAKLNAFCNLPEIEKMKYIASVRQSLASSKIKLGDEVINVMAAAEYFKFKEVCNVYN